jgi:hypothetical protein
MRPTPSLAVATEFPDFDILENASVMMPCGSCGEHYPVTLREILFAQERLHAGCPAQRRGLPTAHLCGARGGVGPSRSRAQLDARDASGGGRGF